jgi:hypothetical protein
MYAGRRGGGTGQPGRHHIGQLQLEGKHQGNLRESDHGKDRHFNKRTE